MVLNPIQAGTTSVFIAKNIKIKIKKFFNFNNRRRHNAKLSFKRTHSKNWIILN